MSPSELYSLLSSEFNVAYDHFDNKQSPPFVVFNFERDIVFYGDDSDYCNVPIYVVTLVTGIKDTVLEQKIENIFKSNLIRYEKSEYYYEAERIYQIEYTVQKK